MTWDDRGCNNVTTIFYSSNFKYIILWIGGSVMVSAEKLNRTTKMYNPFYLWACDHLVWILQMMSIKAMTEPRARAQAHTRVLTDGRLVHAGLVKFFCSSEKVVISEMVSRTVWSRAAPTALKGPYGTHMGLFGPKGPCTNPPCVNLPHSSTRCARAIAIDTDDDLARNWWPFKIPQGRASKANDENGKPKSQTRKQKQWQGNPKHIDNETMHLNNHQVQVIDRILQYLQKRIRIMRKIKQVA